MRSDRVLHVVIAANTIPIVVGILLFPVFRAPLPSEYIVYSLLFWLIAAVSIVVINRRRMDLLVRCLGQDLDLKRVGLFFVLLAALILVANIPTIISARTSIIDNRDFGFKLFFLFEDFLFVSVAVCLAFTIIRRSLLGLIVSIGMVLYVYVAFNRFGLIASAVLVWLCLYARNEKISTVLGQVRARSLRGSVITTMVVALSSFGLYSIESKRYEQGATDGVYDALIDRVGEFATLEVVDKIYATRHFAGFSGFENLSYLYLPSVFFPNKPVINDGPEYMRKTFRMGLGYTSTRFPLLLHNDAFRRFGWWGLICALLPSLFLYLMIAAALFLGRFTGVPFLGLIVVKLAIFMYPKSILGLIEVSFYTFFRSAAVILIVYFVYRILRASLLERKNSAAD